ncbi:MAG: hypothetical protein JWM19_6900 [Actinomycetia bacterium]|nr:hypothetical protein [Actinomycetes bacterium]
MVTDSASSRVAGGAATLRYAGSDAPYKLCTLLAQDGYIQGPTP